MTWKRAIEEARGGRPALLAWMVHDYEIPEAHRQAVANLIANPPTPAKPTGRRLDDQMCQFVRLHFERLRKEGKTADFARDEIARMVNVSVDTVRNVIKERSTYARTSGK